jgi:hypothetical protein
LGAPPLPPETADEVGAADEAGVAVFARDVVDLKLVVLTLLLFCLA